MRLDNIVAILSWGLALVLLVGCESRHDQVMSECEAPEDRAICEWVDMWPPQIVCGGTPPAERAKLESFDLETWKRQGQNFSDAEEAICRLLKSHDKRLNRLKAARTLAEIGTTYSLPVLIECVYDKSDYDIHSEAIAALVHIGVANDKVYGALATQVMYDTRETRGISTFAATALAKLFGKRAISAIKERQEHLKREMIYTGRILEDLENGREVPWLYSPEELEKSEGTQ